MFQQLYCRIQLVVFCHLPGFEAFETSLTLMVEERQVTDDGNPHGMAWMVRWHTRCTEILLVFEHLTMTSVLPTSRVRAADWVGSNVILLPLLLRTWWDGYDYESLVQKELGRPKSCCNLVAFKIVDRLLFINQKFNFKFECFTINILTTFSTCNIRSSYLLFETKIPTKSSKKYILKINNSLMNNQSSPIYLER